MNYYDANKDFTGSRNIHSESNNQEFVEFHNASSTRIWYNTQNEDFSSHWHSAIEIIMPIENAYDVIVEEESFHVKPKELLLIPSGKLHAIIAPSTGSRFIYLFDLSPIEKLHGFSGIQSLMSEPLYMNNRTYPMVFEEIYHLLEQIKEEYFSNKEYSELCIYSLLLQLFSKLGYNHISANNLFPNVRLYKQSEYVQKFNSLLEYIDKHYMEELDLEVIASSIGFSKFHFSRLFKQYTGLTFRDYITFRRIKAAEALLTEPKLSITEIALQSGFSSISTFNRIFKQEKNCTPSEYRAQNHRIDYNQ